MLKYNPLERTTCSKALQMPYFKNKPAPAPAHCMPRPKTKEEKASSNAEARKRQSDTIPSMAKRLRFESD